MNWDSVIDSFICEKLFEWERLRSIVSKYWLSHEMCWNCYSSPWMIF